MAAYADTSFLFALMIREPNTEAALACLQTHRNPLPVTALQRCELRNAIRLAVFRGHADSTSAQAAFGRIDQDFADGNLVDAPLSWTDAIDQADRIGRKHTMMLGMRTLDLLHIGAALSLGLKPFLTFDARQAACARAAGLRVLP